MASFSDPPSTLSSPAPVQSPVARSAAQLVFLHKLEPEPRVHKLGEVLSLIQQACVPPSKREMSYLLLLKKQIWSLMGFFEAHTRLGSEFRLYHNPYLFVDERFKIPFLVQELVEIGDYFAEFKTYTEERDVIRDLVGNSNWPLIPKKSVKHALFPETVVAVDAQDSGIADIKRDIDVSISSDNKQDTTLLTSSRKRSSGNTGSCSHQAGSKMRRGEAEKRLCSSQVLKEMFYLLLDRMENKLNYIKQVSTIICNHILYKLAIEETIGEVLYGFGNKIDGFFERLVDKCKSSNPNIECYMKVVDDCLLTIFQLDALMVGVVLPISNAYDAIEYAPINGDHSMRGALDALRLLGPDEEQEVDEQNIIGASEGRICKLEEATEKIAEVLEEMRARDSITPLNDREELLLKDILRHVSWSISFQICSRPYVQQRDTVDIPDEIWKEVTGEKLITNKDYMAKTEEGRDRLNLDIAGDISDFGTFLVTFKAHLQSQMS